MSRSDLAAIAAAADHLAALCNQALEDGIAVEASEDELGAALAAIVRLHAAKAQDGMFPRAFGRVNDVAVTDVAIVCTAMMEGANLSLFDLGAWQSMAGIGRKLAPNPSYRRTVFDSI